MEIKISLTVLGLPVKGHPAWSWLISFAPTYTLHLINTVYFLQHPNSCFALNVLIMLKGHDLASTSRHTVFLLLLAAISPPICTSKAREACETTSRQRGVSWMCWRPKEAPQR